jgi:type II secretory pathway component GspD/PulD (secretin)
MTRMRFVVLAGILAAARAEPQASDQTLVSQSRLTVLAVPLEAQASGSTAVLSESRVTIDYRAAPAQDVIRILAAATRLKVEIAAGNLRPVTITLTNVKLRTALDAVCDNALCSWVVVDGSLKVTPLPSEPSAALPSTVSFSVHDVSITDALRALAAAIDVPLTVEPSLPSNRVTLNFRNASTALVLDALCNMVQCAWDVDPTRGLRITHKQ